MPYVGVLKRKPPILQLSTLTDRVGKGDQNTVAWHLTLRGFAS